MLYLSLILSELLTSESPCLRSFPREVCSVGGPMPNICWGKPVMVKITSRDLPFEIHSAFEAAQVFDVVVADVKGPKVAEALSIIAAVLSGEAAPSDARLAFIDAAREAGIRIL